MKVGHQFFDVAALLINKVRAQVSSAVRAECTRSRPWGQDGDSDARDAHAYPRAAPRVARPPEGLRVWI